jgi:predicted ester cyclase
VELLEDYGFAPHLVHPLRCKAIASARLKNDKADAATLGQLLRADLLPETGGEWDYQGLKEYFTALRAALDNLTITRGIVVVEGDHVACQTTITGTFVREFTHSPVGPLPPTGNRVMFELMNIFRYDDAGRLAEEWIQTDNRSVLRQLGAEGR